MPADFTSYVDKQNKRPDASTSPMKTVSTAADSITLVLQQLEIRVLRSGVGMYSVGVGVSAVTHDSRPYFLADVDLESLSIELKRLAKLQESTHSSGIRDDSSIHDSEVRVTLRTDEWAMCLHVLNIIVFGCVVEETELYLCLGFRWAEVRAVMESLHDEIKNQVYSLAANHKRILRSRTYRIVAANIVDDPQNKTASLTCRVQPTSWDGELTIDSNGYELRSRIQHGSALAKQVVSLCVVHNPDGKYELASRVLKGKNTSPRKGIEFPIESEELAMQVANFLDNLKLGDQSSDDVESNEE